MLYTPIYKPKLKVFPAFNSYPSIASFVSQVTRKIQNLHVPFLSSSNLQPHLQKALSSLQMNKSIVVKLAEKGGNVVVMDQGNSM